MNIVILGAGALGTVLGAHLAKAGEDVTLIARGHRAAYLQEDGATITGLVDFTVPVTVVTDPHQPSDGSAVLLQVRCTMTACLVTSMRFLPRDLIQLTSKTPRCCWTS